MKRFLSVAGVFIEIGLVVLTFAYLVPRAIVQLTQSPCDAPIRYSIGQVDPRFGLSSADFLSNTKAATDLWNKASNKNIIVYDSQATLTVNLIYDQRQMLLTKINQMEGQLSGSKSSLETQKSQYENLVRDFKQKVADFNSKVVYWNSLGGAPVDIYNQIQKEQADLNNEGQQLNELAQKLNLAVTDYNLQAGDLNQTITNFNQNLQQKPEEGIYDGPAQRIDVYFNVSRNELIHTLAHEFGHAIGLEHINSNSQAIMYPFTSETTALSSLDSLALNSFCHDNIPLVILKNHIQSNFNLLVKTLKYLTQSINIRNNFINIATREVSKLKF